MLRFRSVLDLFCFAYYVIAELSPGRIPFLSDVRAPWRRRGGIGTAGEVAPSDNALA